MKYPTASAKRPHGKADSSLPVTSLPTPPRTAPESTAPAGTAPASTAPASTASTQSSRAALITRVTEVIPAVRKIFEVRPSAEERATWMSLTAHQLEALTALSAGSVTMGELCERLDISESAGTALSDRLVSRGMVLRETDPSDRRIVRLSLSDEARAMVDRFRKLKQKRIAEVLSGLDDDDLDALARVYEQLASTASCTYAADRHQKVVAKKAEGPSVRPVDR